MFRSSQDQNKTSTYGVNALAAHTILCFAMAVNDSPFLTWSARGTTRTLFDAFHKCMRKGAMRRRLSFRHVHCQKNTAERSP